jgi:hypothetical protein
MMAVQFSKHERGVQRGQFIDPVGRLNGTFEQLGEAGCIQAESPELMPLFTQLMLATALNPCAGCPIWSENGPECVAFQRYHSAYRRAEETRQKAVRDATTPSNVPSGHRFSGLTVRQIAGELGVSLSEVRRRKASGTL